MFKLFKRLALVYILIFLLLIVLVVHIFRPEMVNVDRYTIILFAFLFVLSILPSLQSGKISYFFEFKRDLEKAKESVEKLRDEVKVNDKASKEIEKRVDDNIGAGNACLASGWLRQQIYSKLIDINKSLSKSKRSKAKKPITLLEDLKEKGKINKESYQAVKDVLNLCNPDKPFDQMDEDDARGIIDASTPLLEYLEEQS